MAIKVKATQPGFLGYYREPGDVFEIDTEEQFSDVWMVKLDGKPAPKMENPSEGDQEQRTTSSQEVI